MPSAADEGHQSSGQRWLAPHEQTENLLRNPSFRLFLIVQTLSSFGDSFTYVAVPLLVFRTTGSVAQMGLVTGLTGVASIATGVFAGIVADRVSHRTLIMVCDSARCVLYGLIPVVWLFATPIWLVYVVVSLGGAFSMLFQVTYVTVIPEIVRPGQITKANGYLFGTYAAAGAGGPALAGIISAAYSPATAIAVDAVSFAVSAAGILYVRLSARTATVSGEGGSPQAIRGEFAAGARFLWRHPVLRPLTVLLSLQTFFVYGLTDLIIFHIRHDLRYSDSIAGYILTAATIGTLATSFLVARLRKRFGFGPCWVVAYSLAGAMVTVIGLARGAAVLAVITAMIMCCTGLAGICSMSLRQEVTPGRLLGRVTSAFWAIHSVLGPAGAAAVTAAAAGYGVRTVCWVTGPAMLAIAMSGRFTGIWKARPRPGSEDKEPAAPAGS
jgi:MFS family permease